MRWFGWFRWFRRELKPGKCECGHLRSCHKKGRDQCSVAFGWTPGGIAIAQCACLIYIPAAATDDLERLRKMAGIGS